MSKRLIGIRRRVETVLSAYPEARDSDKVLFIRYAQKYLGVTDTTPFVTVVQDHELHFESLRRSRQWFQANAMYESTVQIKTRRAAAQEDYRNSFPGVQ